MVTSFEQVTASRACPQSTDYGLGNGALLSISVDELESVVADLVKKSLSNPALWPSGPSPTPAFLFGPLTPPLEADELEKRLVKAADTESQPDCANIDITPDVSVVREIGFEKVMGGKQDSDAVTGPPNPTPAGIDNDNGPQPPYHVQTDAGPIIPSSDDPTVSSARGSETCKVKSNEHVSTDSKMGEIPLVVENETLQGGRSSSDTTSTIKDDKGTSAAPPRASVLGFKKVMETWDKDTSKYKIVESIETDDAIDDLDQYVFVVRQHVDKHNKEVTSYIDVKSGPLREILRDVLQGVKAVSVMEDKPSIKEDTLFHFLAELCEHMEKLRGDAGTGPAQLAHLTILVNRIQDSYSATTERLASLLQHGEITYDLLWALFKPGCHVYTKCFGTEKPRCVIFDIGEEVTSGGVKYYKLKCRYLDYDGKVFGDAEIHLGIVKYQGSKPISTLEAFPLHHHPDHGKVRKDLVECGKKFCDLTGKQSHFRQCNGVGFVIEKGDIIRMTIDSRVAVDAAFFREMRPNYSRPCLQDTWTKSSSTDLPIISIGTSYDTKETKSKDREQLADDDLLICCPTVRCFSFQDKCFLECAVAGLKDVTWVPESFDRLQIPDDTAQILLALATTRLSLIPTLPFDDIIKGKGRGLNVLLHGPPGVGKTFTVEATSEKFNLPLYSISAAELIGHGKPDDLDRSLDEIFKIAKYFNAVLLLDEADVFMERRTSYHDGHNQLLSVFLRKLEYFEGILFMTTNQVTEFDEAILSRIHLKVRYEDLTREARRELWEYFLSKAHTHEGPSIIHNSDLECLEAITLNGRDIKNLTSIAHSLATFNGTQMTYKHLEVAVRSNDKFVDEVNNHGRMEGLYT